MFAVLTVVTLVQVILISMKSLFPSFLITVAGISAYALDAPIELALASIVAGGFSATLYSVSLRRH